MILRIARIIGKVTLNRREQFALEKVLIDELEFDGWVGCEYRPRANTIDGLAWAVPYGIGR